MLRFAKECLRGRIAQIEAMIAQGALFQAELTLRGGRRCSSMHTCGTWDECAAAHEGLLRRVSELLSHQDTAFPAE